MAAPSPSLLGTSGGRLPSAHKVKRLAALLAQRPCAGCYPCSETGILLPSCSEAAGWLHFLFTDKMLAAFLLRGFRLAALQD